MKDRVKKTVLILLLGVAVNIALAIIKMYVGYSSNSLTIMIDATNNSFDIATCIVTLLAFVMLLRPRNEKAPFGYGRVEYLAGFIVAVVSVVVGGLFFIRSLNRLAMPEPVWFGLQNCILIAVSIPIKFGLGLFYYFMNRKLRSKAVAAIMLDSFMDTAITATSLVSFAISSNVDYAVDAIFGIVMSILIVIFAIKLVVDNVKIIVLGDGAADEKAAIEKLCGRYDEIIGVLKISLHDYGYASKAGTVEIDFNGETDSEIKLDICAELGSKLKETTGAEVLFYPKRDEAVHCDVDTAQAEGKEDITHN